MKKPKITIRDLSQDDGIPECPTELEADIIVAGSAPMTPEQDAKARKRFSAAKEYIFTPEQVAQLAQDGLTPEDLVEMISQGQGEVRQLL